jgi:hypothetical protein
MSKSKLALLILIVLLLLLAGCGGTQGIDSPIEVDGVELQLVSAELADTLDMGSQELRPSSAGDTILSVKASSSVDNPQIKVSVTDESGRVDTPSVVQSESASGEYSVTWIFGVSKSAKSFTLMLPGEIKLKLDSLLK